MDISDGIYENLKERAALAFTASSSSSGNSSSSSRSADGHESSLEDAAALYGTLSGSQCFDISPTDIQIWLSLSSTRDEESLVMTRIK